MLPLHQTRSLSFLHASDVRQQGPWGEQPVRQAAEGEADIRYQLKSQVNW